MSDQLATIEKFNIFKVTPEDKLHRLFLEYRVHKISIYELAKVFESKGTQKALSYFVEGTSTDPQNRVHFPSLKIEDAMRALNAEFWQKAFELTDVVDFMPNERRQEWFEKIREMKTPDFEETIVKDTIGELLLKRPDFLSEMVDGIFRGLSREHVTNRPEGFTKRFIVDYMYNGGYATQKEGLVQDLRIVLAKFMGRGGIEYTNTRSLMAHFKEYPGEWHNVDGSAFRIKVFKKGTAHIEVHPDIAWKLNVMLAHLYPNSIPSPHRQRPKNKKPVKNFVMTHDLIPFTVLNEITDFKVESVSEIRDRLVGMTKAWDNTVSEKALDRHDSFVQKHPSMTYEATFRGRYGTDSDKHLKKRVSDLIESIGGVQIQNRWYFDYDPTEVIRGIIVRGSVPEQKSHQYYPTPSSIAERAVEWAEIEDGMRCLEPSAGQGGLADWMPQNTHCVEISAMHCDILREKGFNVTEGDFMKTDILEHYDRIVMNPPFSEKRAELHLRRAADLLVIGGILVAVLPSSYANKYDLVDDRFDGEWSEVIENEFDGTGVSVVLLKLRRTS